MPGHAGARNCKFLEKVSVTDMACKVKMTKGRHSDTFPPQDDANWKQYAVHASDVPVQKVECIIVTQLSDLKQFICYS